MNLISDILPSAFSVLGGPGEDRLDLADTLGDRRRIVLLLVDGLGYHLLPRAAEASGLFADIAAGRAGRLDQLECTVPSTTPTSLVSLGTGVRPGQHGILGFTLNVPGTDRVLSHIMWRDDPPVEQWQPLPTTFTLAARAGIESAVVLPAIFAGSGLTRSAYGGATFLGVGRGGDQVGAIAYALECGARLVYTYASAVDTAAHARGIASAQWANAVAKVGTLIERLRTVLPADTALLVTADHGGVDVPERARIDLSNDPALRANIRVVAGEPRFRHLHAIPGAAADVHAAWSATLGDRAQVLIRDEAVATGMFGPVSTPNLPRIGDVVVVCNGDTAILATGYEPPESARLVAYHGARTPAEIAIPLINFR